MRGSSSLRDHLTSDHLAKVGFVVCACACVSVCKCLFVRSFVRLCVRSFVSLFVCVRLEASNLKEGANKARSTRRARPPRPSGGVSILEGRRKFSRPQLRAVNGVLNGSVQHVRCVAVGCMARPSRVGACCGRRTARPSHNYQRTATHTV